MVQGAVFSERAHLIEIKAAVSRYESLLAYFAIEGKIPSEGDLRKIEDEKKYIVLHAQALQGKKAF